MIFYQRVIFTGAVMEIVIEVSSSQKLCAPNGLKVLDEARVFFPETLLKSLLIRDFPIASLSLTEEEARESGKFFETNKIDLNIENINEFCDFQFRKLGEKTVAEWMLNKDKVFSAWKKKCFSENI